jgi:membrane carboxypeptidase/penicillin-binding protein
MSRRTRKSRACRKDGLAILARFALAAFAAALLLTVVGAVTMLAVVDGWLSDLPDYTSATAFQVPQATRVYSADGKLLARLYLQNRDVVPM